MVFLLAGAALAPAGDAAAQQLIDVQYRPKAGLVYQMALFIKPEKIVPGEGGTFVIGILGRDPFVGIDEARRRVNHLQDVVRAKKKLDGLTLVVRQFDSAKDYKPCHVLFVSPLAAETSVERTPDERLAAALAKTKGSSVLIIGDTAGFAQAGAVVNFYAVRGPEGGKVEFEINPQAAERAKLNVDRRILGLGHVVLDGAADPRSGSK